jgi:hypothetical protein
MNTHACEGDNTMTIRTYCVPGDDGTEEYVIADEGGWCPGVFDSEETARYAHRMGYSLMVHMWDAHLARYPVPAPPMTRLQVSEAAQQIRGSELHVATRTGREHPYL